jgi:hypothetical protein
MIPSSGLNPCRGFALVCLAALLAKAHGSLLCNGVKVPFGIRHPSIAVNILCLNAAPAVGFDNILAYSELPKALCKAAKRAVLRCRTCRIAAWYGLFYGATWRMR